MGTPPGQAGVFRGRQVGRLFESADEAFHRLIVIKKG
jgi:hypothetical protein